MMLQVAGAIPTSALELLKESSVVTWGIMGLLGLFSLLTWFFIAVKLWQFRKVRRQGDRVFAALERTTRLEDPYHAVVKLPSSPYGRILKEGVNFFAELRPAALQATADPAQSVLDPFCRAHDIRATCSSWTRRFSPRRPRSTRR